LIFSKAVGGNENAQLYLLSPDGSQIKALTDAPKIRHNFGAWSHDGKRISYASNKRDPNFFDVYVMDVATGREQLIYQQNGSNSPEAWSFDDSKIIVSHDSDQLSLDNDLFLVDLATKQATPLTPHEGASQFGSAHFTRDGRSLIFATNDKREFYSLARMDLGASASRRSTKRRTTLRQRRCRTTGACSRTRSTATASAKFTCAG
jgi:Tol biopolymer transport system component